MDYKNQTLKMIKIIKEKNSLNVMKHFYAQLSVVEELDVFNIVNAISDTSTTYDMLLNNSIMKKPWIMNTSLKNIRNVIVFLLWKHHQILINEDESWLFEIDDIKYNTLKKIDNNNRYSNDLMNLILNSFYIHQIYQIKQFLSIDDDWNCFSDFLKEYYTNNGLPKLVYYCFSLIKPVL